MSSDTINSLCIIVLAAIIVVYQVNDIIKDHFERTHKTARALQVNRFMDDISTMEREHEYAQHLRRMARKAHRLRLAKRRGVAR